MSFVERLENGCLRFDFASERGYARDDLLPGLRIAGFERRVTMAFVVMEEQVSILRFFYGGRDWEKEF
jgi:toxin ParE1/3/4